MVDYESHRSVLSFVDDAEKNTLQSKALEQIENYVIIRAYLRFYTTK